MTRFICLFFPSLLALWIFEHLAKTNLSLKRTAYLYAFNVIVINVFVMLINRYVLRIEQKVAANLVEFSTPGFVYYLAVAVPLSAFMGLMERFWHKFVQVTVEKNIDEPDEETADDTEE